MLRQVLAASLLCVGLGACQTTGGSIGSVLTGECQLTHTPTYAVRGKTKYDQDWVDDTTESLVAGCNQPRPKARPASYDASPKPVATTAVLPNGESVPLPKPKPKHRIWNRIKAWFPKKTTL